MRDASLTTSEPPPAPSSEARPAWRLNLVLFLATVASVFVTGVVSFPSKPDDPMITRAALLHGAQFVGTVMTILVAHELGHYVTARIHKVDASLPFFIPLPLLSPFGTMGAVIRMRGVIPTRRALLDIGASGPLAGMAFAIPLYLYGVAHSEVVPANGEGMVELGESVMVRFLDHFFAPPVPEGMTVVYSPIAFGAWGGMFVTMINLLPVGQLDGGHVAYALFGPKQDRYAITVHRAMLVFFGVIVAGHVMRDVQAGRALTVPLLSQHVANALFWLVWFQVLGILGTLARPRRPEPEPQGDEGGGALGLLTVRTRIFATLGLVTLASIGRQQPSLLLLGGFVAGLGILIAMEVKGGVLRPHDLLVHPPTGPEGLDLPRKIVAIVSLVLFALLFMPEPFSL
ncbi:MAG: site-2 protease family protein [Labilithrix sp.]|nr:site-2 protease family protein [Labilithrix sp.]MCW5810251.1 site-2 protease family protein [Labilithrix sp.]